MTAGEGVSGMDLSIAGHTEGSSVCLAEECGGGPLTGLADPSTVMAGGEAVGSVDAGVAGRAEVGRVGKAVDSASGSAAGVAGTTPGEDTTAVA